MTTRASGKAVEKKSTKIKGGARPGAGRKKGSPNKKTAELQKAVAESGATPLEFMLKIMRTEAADDIEDHRVLVDLLQMRFEAAKAAAPYVHPRLAAVEHTGADGGPLVQRIEQIIIDGAREHAAR